MESWNILEILPPEVMVLVFSNLEPEDILSSLSVSKLWNALHSGFNWKEAFVITFGELSSSIVDVTRKFNWRKLFFDRKTLSSMCIRPKIKELRKPKYDTTNVNNQYIRVVTTDTVIYSVGDDYYCIDLRLLKKDPTIAKEKLIPRVAALPSLKSGPYSSYYYHGSNNINNNLILEFHGKDGNDSVLAFWNLKKGAKTLSSVALNNLFRYVSYGANNIQNSKYILWNNRPQGCLIDMSKRCHHYCDLEKKDLFWEREKFPISCVNKDKCAIIDTWSEYYWSPYLSSEDPDLITGILVKTEGYALVISRIGQQRTEVIVSTTLGPRPEQFKLGSEHAIRSRKKIVKHWFSFEVNKELYFIDLMDTKRKLKTAVVHKYEWIPNESKVVLQNNNILIVFDLETATWCSKITFKQQRIIDFSILSNRGFIAVLEGDLIVPNRYITICHWETGAKTRSIEVTEYNVSNIKLISDSLLLIYNYDSMSFIKL